MKILAAGKIHQLEGNRDHDHIFRSETNGIPIIVPGPTCYNVTMQSPFFQEPFEPDDCVCLIKVPEDQFTKICEADFRKFLSEYEITAPFEYWQETLQAFAEWQEVEALAKDDPEPEWIELNGDCYRCKQKIRTTSAIGHRVECPNYDQAYIVTESDYGDQPVDLQPFIWLEPVK